MELQPEDEREPRRATDSGVDWMLRYQGGEERAFDHLVEAYSPRVYVLVTRFLGRVANREDLVQEVFLRVIRARAEYRPAARFSTWLYRIVFNLCVNEGERRRLPSSIRGSADREGLDWPDERAPAPSEALERAARVESVRRALMALPERQRMALVLATYQDLPYEEIAKALDTSEKAVKSLVHRARESLRAELAQFLEEEVA